MSVKNFNFSGRVRIGLAPTDIANAALFTIRSNTNSECEIHQEQYTGDTSAPTHDFRKARGTYTVPADAQIDDRIIDIRALPRSTTFQFGAAFRAYVDGPALVAGQNAPTRLEFQTSLLNQASRAVAWMTSEGYLGISNGLFTVSKRPEAHIHVVGEATGAGSDLHIHIEKCTADANSGLFEFFKSRGTFSGAKGNVTENDVTGRIQAFAYSAVYKDGPVIQFAVDAAVVNNQAPAARIEFYVNANNQAPQLYSKLASNGFWRNGVGFCALATSEGLVQPGDGHVWASDSGETAQHLYQIRASTANGPNHIFRRSRGSFAGNISTPTNGNVVDGDRIVRIEGAAWSGATGWWAGARMDTEVDGAVTDNQRPGSKFRFFTNVPNGAVTERLAIQGDGIVNLAPTIAAVAGGSTTAALTLGTAPGVLGVYWGSGAPSISAGKGSLYLRTDGSGTTNRAYINTNGGTTWTAITTVA